jgi:hypothetical protein
MGAGICGEESEIKKIEDIEKVILKEITKIFVNLIISKMINVNSKMNLMILMLIEYFKDLKILEIHAI